MRGTSGSEPESLRCSFCQKPQQAVGKLISTPGDSPRAYICDECVAICVSIIEEDRQAPDQPAADEPDEPHPLLSHPLASQLMASIEQWIREESLGKDAAAQLAEVRRIAQIIAAQGR